jgi:hypothetical protein
MQTHYDVLGVPWKANDDQIKRLKFELSKRVILICMLAIGTRSAAQEVLAHMILRKPQRRVIYDRLLRAEVARALNALC